MRTIAYDAVHRDHDSSLKALTRPKYILRQLNAHHRIRRSAQRPRQLFEGPDTAKIYSQTAQCAPSHTTQSTETTTAL